MIITVFGGSAVREGQPDYETGRQLGYQLGKAGHALLTGGYIGMMEAVSRGGNEAGARVIGATCSQIEKSNLNRKPNPFLNEVWSFETLKDRLYALVSRCDAAIAMPGGVGTLAEIAISWNELILSPIDAKPLILFGGGWEDIFTKFTDDFDMYISKHDRNLIQFAADIPSVLEIIQNFRGERE